MGFYQQGAPMLIFARSPDILGQNIIGLDFMTIFVN